MKFTTPLVLASASPRRRELLERLGFRIDVIPPNVDEDLSIEDPSRLALVLALQKASRVARSRPSSITIGADTIVVTDGAILGKPASRAEAISMLTRLSGRQHTVVTGVALVEHSTGRRALGVERTVVTFARLRPSEIEAYVETGSPFDKAGGYGVQDDHGALMIERIDGDYYNVVGLPLRRLYELFVGSFRDRIMRSDGHSF